MPGLGGLKEMLKELPLVQEVGVGEKRHGGRWFLNLLVRRVKGRDGVEVNFLEGAAILKVLASGCVGRDGWCGGGQRN